MQGNFSFFLSSADFFFSKNFRNTIRVSNILDPDYASHFHFIGPGLGPSCLQRLSADNTSRQRVRPKFLDNKSGTTT